MGRKWDSSGQGKGGGSKYKADMSDDKGALTCGNCKGSGEVFREHTADYEDDEAKSDLDSMKCPTCGGAGKVSS